ncbi:prephenate/arogenate dehydrogenase [Oscillatoria sp. CS-180]|uniref:prephenate/arogenate dehydrogenase n=1 Tax=Oscillatoria sp. CS-180 TaxID=3021720 RepID=UPI0023302C8F|nr:prephenate/arogenate dehydrogenase [Oscillatoria sp. CS-180]MDB9529009.1 prephenate/arogenate dehydrogenase [Oscillatoria sp. CS-180]
MKIGIVGLGLIGGSLGLDFTRLGHQVVGVARRQATCEAAIAQGAVQQASMDLQALSNADIIFICTPLHVIESTAIALVPHLSPQTVLTDVGSVKGTIVDAVTRHWPNFVGGHPMAGKTEVGIEVAEPHLFAHRAYVITPTAQTPLAAVDRLATLARDIKAVVHTCSPAIHDRAVAWISHLPVMISGSLIQACLQEPDPQVRKLAQQFASSGFRDTSRVGGGHPDLGLLMASHNRQEVLRSLTVYQQQIQQLMAWIEAENWEAIAAQLTENHHVRPAFTQSAPAPDTAEP